MSEQRYHGVKITTTRLASGRWLAHSGYGYAHGETEGDALRDVRREIDRNVGEAARNAKAQRERIARSEARKHEYRVTFTNGHSMTVRAASKSDAARKAKTEYLGRRPAPWMQGTAVKDTERR